MVEFVVKMIMMPLVQAGAPHCYQLDPPSHSCGPNGKGTESFVS
jgi:hypothetical protein